MSLQDQIQAFQLILDLVHVEGHPPRGTAVQLRKLQELDPVAAERIIDRWEGAR